MGDKLLYTDPLGNNLYIDELGSYVVDYPNDSSETFEKEELPFQVGDTANGVNGVTNELLIEAVTHRLERLEVKKPSIHNRLAIILLKAAGNILAAKDEDEKLHESLKGDKLTDGDENALEVYRWQSVIRTVQEATKGMQTALSQTYRNGSKVRSVDFKRIRHPIIAKLFK